MKAQIVEATSMKRVILGEVAPLEVPFTLEIFPTNVCNFKCIYCAHSTMEAETQQTFLPIELYKKCIDDLSGFNKKLKVILFAGLGEPLIHPQIAEMVRYAKESKVAETIRIITNGSLLTREMSDSLIDAGLDSLKISIQGLSNEKYKEMCDSHIPLETIIDNIRYFYSHKKDTVVNVKIVSDVFEEPSDEQKFYEMFGDICDQMNIEHIASYQDTAIMGKKQGYISQTGTNEMPNKICQLPFYFYSVLENGDIIPCCTLDVGRNNQLSLGNIVDTNLSKIWNSDKFMDFRLMHLREEKYKNSVCKNCYASYQSQCRKEDNIDLYKDQIIEKIKMYKRG